MECVTLNNGVKMPLVGFGVYQIPASDCERCVLDAFACGYRLIDTAQAYLNEKEVGAAVRSSGIKREEIFVTSKVWLSNCGYDKTKASVYHSLELMGLDYLDLMLLHQPFGDHWGSYSALADMQKEGVLKAIGVSNFFPWALANLARFHEVVPQVNQIEINPLYQRQAEIELMAKLQVQPEAWAPFGEGKNNMFAHPVLAEIGAKLHKSVAQVIVRYLTQKQIVVLAKTTHKERMQENINVFDFTLDAEDIAKIAQLDTHAPLFFDHGDVSQVEVFKQFTDAVGKMLV